MLLFKVDNIFLVTGFRLVLTPGLGDKIAKVGDKIKLVRPNRSFIETKIIGIAFNQNRDISIGTEFTKDEIPIGTEVWLINGETPNFDPSNSKKNKSSLMKGKFCILLILLTFMLTTNGWAEGQRGLGTLLLIFYVFSFCFYTLVGGLIIRLILKIFKVKSLSSGLIPFLISFLITGILLFVLGDNFILFI